MTGSERNEAYRAAWASFYSSQHVRTILRRTTANPRGRPGTTLSMLLGFWLMIAFEDVHPLEGGAFRRKSRRDRRLTLRRESPFTFYPRYFCETAVKAWRYWSVYRAWTTILKEVLAAPDRASYTDLAVASPSEDEFEVLDLYPRHQRRRGSTGTQAPQRFRRLPELGRGYGGSAVGQRSGPSIVLISGAGALAIGERSGDQEVVFMPPSKHGNLVA